MSNDIVQSRRLMRPATLLLCGIVILFVLAAIFDHAQQSLLRHQAERLLADIQSVALLQTATVAHSAQPLDKSAENVIDRFLKLVGDGSLLTRDGWKDAEELSNESNGFSDQTPIFLLTAVPEIAGERWTKEDQAEVEIYCPDVGRIDSAFIYRAPERPYAVVQLCAFDLLLTDKHSELGRDAEKAQKVTEVNQWKMKGPVERWATVGKAITYLTAKRGEASDAGTRENIEKTLATLKRLNGSRRNACAC